MLRLPLLVLSLVSLPPWLCAQHPRLHTDRTEGPQLLRLPKEDDAFGFVVFGDRTGGPAAGIRVLEQAVRDTNLLDPDLVLTVGDLVQGYNDGPAWRKQAEEYRSTMADLRMPWFPVAGNHDIYWRGAGRPAGEHERDYELTFGPLWYAFEHKQCWFVVLYSDEGEPKNGVKDFNDPACQRMSEAQFGWLGATLKKAKGARHVFMFLHHPRWLRERYAGSDWERVHALLAQNGNVTAVFAGHIHRMRFDGVRDGIEYYTVASVGAHLEFAAPQAGFLHQFHVVTVRPGGIQVAALPVGTVMDPKLITGEVSEDADLLHERLAAVNVRGVTFGRDGGVDGILQFDVHNPARRPVELTLWPSGEGYVFTPDHQHTVVAPGQATTVAFAVRRPALPEEPLQLPGLELRCDYLGEGLRFSLPPRRGQLAIPPPADFGVVPAARDGALVLAADGDCLELDASRAALPDGPLTVEAWLCGDDFRGRRGLVNKTESSEFGLFVSDGKVEFSVFVGGRYATAESKERVLQPGRWHHVAGVFDGQQVRACVDGKVVARAAGSGSRRTNALPLFVGADTDGRGQPTSFFRGRIDEVRISTAARYADADFAPARRFEPDAATAWLLHLDQDAGAWTPDDGPRRLHPVRRGGAACALIDEAPR
jgi:hypothetical protein